jgi:hypothetical protein
MKYRAELSEEYFESPNLKSKEILNDSNDDEYHWYYKSNQSEKWWKYDVCFKLNLILLLILLLYSLDEFKF